MQEQFRKDLREATDVLARMAQDERLLDELERLAEACIGCLRAGGKLLFAGNGGSAADAQHWAAELVSRFNYDRPGLAAIALTTDTSALTAIGNDYGYDQVFARQIEALGRPGDVFVGISTSGASPNVLSALAAARQGGLHTAAFTGAAGDRLAPLCDHLIRIPARATPLIQQGHAVLGHALCEAIELSMFPSSSAPV